MNFAIENHNNLSSHLRISRNNYRFCKPLSNMINSIHSMSGSVIIKTVKTLDI